MPVPRFVVALLAAAVAGCGGSVTTMAPAPTVELPPLVVVIAPGLRPRMTPSEVSLMCIARIKGMEQIAGEVLKPARIVSVKALPEAAAWAELGSVNGADAIVWLVRAEGTFAFARGLSGRNVAPPAATGWFMIRDADASIAGEGYPAP